MPQASNILYSLDAREIAPLVMGKDYDDFELTQVAQDHGIGWTPRAIADMRAAAMDAAFAMDAYPTIQQTLTTASISTLVQFLQEWLPGMVKILTAARKGDEIVGISTVGSWEDEEIVMPVLENTGTAVPYGDATNVPLSNWNINYNTRTVIRFEEGMRVGVLEEARAARQRVNSGQTKRESAALDLEVQRNAVCFYGYNNGNNSTYGFLNDPSIPAYVEVATGVGGFHWSQKTFLEICADIRTALGALQTQSQDTIEPGKTKITLAIATASVIYLSVTSNYGMSVWGWLKETFGDTIRVVSAPQLNAANASDNVFVAFADTIDDTSTDDKRTFIQVVPQKFFLVGVQKLAKGYEEDYSNSTAGVMCKRPYAVVRYYNI